MSCPLINTVSSIYSEGLSAPQIVATFAQNKEKSVQQVGRKVHIFAVGQYNPVSFSTFREEKKTDKL